MTPKEKAEQLVKRFKQYVNSDVSGEQNFEFSYEEQLKNAKQCALITVDEIMKSRSISNSIEYWKNVKQEIEQL